jgi:hypothetical protein
MGKDRRVFEVDRRMELKMRLAAKKAAAQGQTGELPMELGGYPERQIVTRLIERVRRL